MDLVQAFEDYAEIADELFDAVFEYADYLSEISHQELKEQVFHQEVSLKEKEDLKELIEKSGDKVQELYVKFLNQTNIVKTAVNNEQKYLNTKTIKYLNDKHLDVFIRYIPVQRMLKRLKKRYPKYDFAKVTNIAAMERQKGLLNEAIEDFNFRLMANSKVKLWTVDKCITEAEKELGSQK